MSAQGSESTHSASFPCPCDDFNTGAYPGKNPNGLSARPPQKHRTGYRTGGRSCTARLLPTESNGVVSLSVYAFSYVHAAPRDAAPAARRTRPGTSSPPHQSTSTTHEDRRGQRGACRDVR